MDPNTIEVCSSIYYKHSHTKIKFKNTIDKILLTLGIVCTIILVNRIFPISLFAFVSNLYQSPLRRKLHK